jgi:hypothetical protein
MVDKSGMTRTQIGTHNISEMVAVQGLLVRYNLVTVTVWATGRKSLHILNFGTRWSSVMSFTHWPHYPPQEEDQVPTGQVARRTVDQVWARRQNKSMSLLGIDCSHLIYRWNNRVKESANSFKIL